MSLKDNMDDVDFWLGRICNPEIDSSETKMGNLEGPWILHLDFVQVYNKYLNLIYVL